MSIEAMKQWLEALENSIDDVRDCLNQNLPLAGYARYDQRIEWYREQIAKHEDAITSLRQAIEQAEKQEPVALKKGECWPEDVMQEWIYWRKEIANGFTGSAPRDWFENLASMKLVDAQPQREWVGLTDAELAEFSDMKLGAYDLCLEVDAKLRSKNT